MFGASFDAEAQATHFLAGHLHHPLLDLGSCPRAAIAAVVVVQVIRVGGQGVAETGVGRRGREIVVRGRNRRLVQLLQSQQFHGQLEAHGFWPCLAIADSVWGGWNDLEGREGCFVFFFFTHLTIPERTLKF